jgi:hypothetical protein
MESKYVFENKKVNVKNIRSGHNNIYVSEELLNKISIRWNCPDLCNNIKNCNMINLFNDRICDVQPILINNVKILDNGDVLSFDENILYRTTFHQNNPINQSDILSKIGICSYENVICLTGKWSSEVFHFPFEFLCGLRTIDNYKNKFIHVKKNKYVLEWLELCDFNLSQVIDGTILAINLYIPYFPPCGSPDVADILWLKNIVEKHITRHTPKNKIILVKRNNTRCVTNYDDLEKYIKTYSYNMNLDLIIHADNALPDLKTQLQYFSDAKIIITPHGGSEVNLLACDNNTYVIELMDINYTNLCFVRIAYFLNLRYYAMDMVDHTINLDEFIKILDKCV